METPWDLSDSNPQAAARLVTELGLRPAIARILVNRRIVDPEAARLFLQPGLDQLPPPEGIEGLQQAAARVAEAVVNGQRILVFGDYDADGVTATALLTGFLEQAGGRVTAYIPDRFEDGYGLQPRHVIEQANARGCRLIVTVDCGAGSHAAIQAAQSCGIDVVVTDHHLPDADALPAAAVVNPRCGFCDDALHHLAGVGVAFYLAIAMRAHLRRIGWWQKHREPNLRHFCDLVAIGTVADMVPLTGANRILTHEGLQVMRQGGRPGTDALMAASAIPRGTIDSQDIAFRLAPRINAAGRLGSARLALALLRCPDPAAASRLASRLDDLNRQRRDLEEEIFAEALYRLKQDGRLEARRVLVLADPQWHEGVIGIVAGRLAKHYHRPTVVLTGSDGLLKGSARSIAGLDICEAFQSAANHLCTFGGHPMAAGLSLEPGQLDAFSSDLDAVVGRLAPYAGTPPALRIDAELDLEHITPDFLEAVSALGPFGNGNPEPVFAARDLRVREPRIVGRHHLRMMLCQNDRSAGREVAAIRFHVPPDAIAPKRLAAAAFRLGWNRFNGQCSVQMVIAETR